MLSLFPLKTGILLNTVEGTIKILQKSCVRSLTSRGALTHIVARSFIETVNFCLLQFFRAFQEPFMASKN